MAPARYASALLMFVISTSAAESCESFRDPRGRSDIDFAPPNGFVDVCSQDVALCHELTKGYPPSVQTIAYFALEDEWRHYSRDQKGFSRYLIAQVTDPISDSDFLELKSQIRRAHGNIPDNTKTHERVELQERTSFGVIDETSDSISFGVTMKIASNSDSRVLSAINTALILKREFLSLYAFATAAPERGVDEVKALSRSWLLCLRTSNPSI
jgi:hypothetical protein